MLCFVLTSLSWRMRYQFVSISLTLLRSLSESSLLFLSEVHCVGGPGPEPETVYKCVGRGQSSHLTRANAAIRTNGADTIISHYPDPAPGSHWDLQQHWTMIQETRSAQTRVWHDFCENVNLNNCVYLCLHLLNDCHRHFCLSVVTKTNIAHRF